MQVSVEKELPRASVSRRVLRTPPRSTRGKPTISYAEPSTDSDDDLEEEENGNAAEQPHRDTSRTPRTRVPRTSTRNPPPSRSANSKTHVATTKSTRQKPVISYAEASTDTESEEEEDEGEDNEQSHNSSFHTPRSRLPRNASGSRASTKRLLSRSPESMPKRRKQKRSISFRRSIVQSPSIISAEDSGNIPPWQTLPYHVLVQIFEYATYPLYEERTFQPLPSGRWLLDVAYLCRGFAEPAFTVLYNSPPLVPMDKAHRLVELLKSDPASVTFGYRQKVVNLRIEVRQVACYSLPGSGLLDLYGLIRDLPRLADLEFFDEKDSKPFKQLDEPIRWEYPAAVFEALEHVEPVADSTKGDKTSLCKLRSWRWSSRLGGKRWPIERMREIHLKPSFIDLKKVAFVNYQIRHPKKGEDDPMLEEILAESLSVLENLEHLIFESSTLLNAKLMPLLPSNLRNLEITNCWEVTAEMLGEYLVTRGRQIRCLTLNHNSALSLAFLPSLGTACPYLEALRMDLQYFDAHVSYHNSEPDYDQLLKSDQIPVWPPTLQTLELVNLRKWDQEAAEMFFQSLLDSAGELPDLRVLILQASINTGWRDRASFRDKWIGTLGHVFKRICDPPKHFTKASELPEAKPSKLESDPQHNEQSPAKNKKVQPKGNSLPIRQSTRAKRTTNYAESPDNSNDEDDEDDEDDDKEDEEDEEVDDMKSSSPRPSKSKLSDRELAQNRRASREVRMLKITAGIDGFPSSPPQTPGSGEEDMDDASSVSESENGNQHAGGRGKKKQKQNLVIQGMCEVVNIIIDNKRPAETQFGEADFLDSEPEGDDDWDGDDGLVEGGLAW
ncbi:hypothetical protein SS1G_07790 [Sclerotinia sclerotiorum 1980 UF-70]|uniref:F-box domain-containing protein n=1 Tax=Sclerotinia sclerotiorum (strain ATCC 18683 / 1980 / Ss-1) TaxID=665079 RepID=A7ER37_SCLS1|nr:hypothetical protein SS1G_07790 [Sclerotinia sclerotiorum 1980 UF-70]EDN91929.1 hypothetical protein SS1G_07790 [Sclerotinia sclerotiorum 1980 UF-70]